MTIIFSFFLLLKLLIPKGVPFETLLLFRKPVFPSSAVKCGSAHTAFFKRRLCCNKLFAPQPYRLRKILEQRYFGSAAAYSPQLCGGNALCLPFFNVFSFALRDKGKYLQNQIGNKCPHKVLTLPCVQKRHIYNANINAYFLCQDTPLPLYFLVIAP